jgi:hypothetical protein
MRPTRRAAFRQAALLMLFTAGCTVGPRLEQAEKVTGTVRMDGKALAKVHVQFFPQVGADVKAPSSAGMTDDEGRYELTCENGKPGAIIASHKVVVVSGRSAEAEPNDDPGAPQAKTSATVPAVYGIAAKTPLEVEVKANETTYDLNLSSRPGKK